MRAVVQRVSAAAVRVAGETVGEIPGGGLLVLLGVTHTDDAARAAKMADKLAGLRIMSGEVSVQDVAGAGVLVVSQFTLYGDTRKGRRPSWSQAAPAAVAEPLVDAVVERLRASGLRVATGRFGADMVVSLDNEGPFTVLVEV